MLKHLGIPLTNADKFGDAGIVVKRPEIGILADIDNPSYFGIFPTREEALEWSRAVIYGLISKHEQEISVAQERIVVYRNRLSKLGEKSNDHH